MRWPLAFSVLLLAAPGIAGCIEPTLDDVPVEAAALVDPLPGVAAFTATLAPGASTAAYRVHVPAEAWVEEDEIHWLHLAFEIDGVDDDFLARVLVARIDGDELMPFGSGIASEGSFGLGYGTSKAPRDQDLVVLAGTDDPEGALRVRFGVVDDWSQDLPADLPPLEPFATGTGARVSAYLEYGNPLFLLLGGTTFTHDVEVEDTRLTPLAGLPTQRLSLAARHDIAGPHLRTAMGVLWNDVGADEWAFACTDDNATQEAKGYAIGVHATSFLGAGWCDGTSEAASSATFEITPTDAMPLIVLTASSFPIDLGTLGYTLEDAFDSSSILPQVIRLNGAAVTLTQDGVAPGAWARTLID